MVIVETVIVVFSMFSALPMPDIRWSEQNMRYSLCAFPMVGALIGLSCWLWFLFCAFLPFPAVSVLRGAGLCLLPVLISGGIHLDGYADTSDALACHGSVEKKQEILKDPHIGAFGVIRLCIWFIADFAVCTSLPDCSLPVFLFVFCASRILSALSLTCFPLRPGSGSARTFADSAQKKSVRAILILYLVFLIVLLILSGSFAVLPVLPILFYHYFLTSVKLFGGLSGDLAGWFLQKAEFWMLASVCLWHYLRMLL